MANVNKQTDSNAPGPLLNDKMIKDLVAGEVAGADKVYEWLGGKPFEDTSSNKGYKLRLAIANKVGANLAALPANPEAPARADMPQFDPKVGGPNLKDVEGMLGGGKTGDANLAPPFAKESTIKKRLDLYLKESINKFNIGKI